MAPEIYNETNIKIPKIDFLDLKNNILGNDFDLSISFLLPKNSQKINKKQRGQSYVPNTLSFKYSNNSGEIVLTPEVIENEEYNLDAQSISLLDDKIIYLLIHSMLHLTDLDHGIEMDNLEKKYFNQYKN